MKRLCRDLAFLSTLLAFAMLPGCFDPAYLPVVAVPVVTGLLVQTNERTKAPTSNVTPTPTTPPAPTSPPLACPPPLGTATMVTCSDFRCRDEAQDFFNALINAGLGDCHDLDLDGNGQVCLILPECPNR
jgi:hypothetical protein